MKLGILGGGQLGLMLASAARDLGIETLVVDPKAGAVAGRIAEHLALDWEDPAAIEALAGCDVVTYEFENVPTAALERLVSCVPVHPAPLCLEVSGDRITEKNLFRDLGIETAPFLEVNTRADLDRAIAEIGLPAVLKTRRFGYDGKGQAVLRSEADVGRAWERLGEHALILEGFVPFEREVSVIAARGIDGSMCYWPITENDHVDGILHVSRAPAANVTPALFESAKRGLESIMAKLDYVGVLVIEFFQLEGRLIANEMACRVHNSGHWTIEGAKTSQFENHVRAVVGLPLGDTELVGPSAMLNIVGDVPELEEIGRDPATHVHLYGKSPAKGRKLGHVSVVSESAREVEARLKRIFEVVGDRGDSERED